MAGRNDRRPAWARRPAPSASAVAEVHGRERGDERVLAGLSQLRAEAAYAAAADCPACDAARAEAGDAEALCDEHLGQAMGMHSNWDAIRER